MIVQVVGPRHSCRRRRPGVALVWVVVVLVVVSAVTGILLGHLKINRARSDQRQNLLQAEWLARAGVELAAARLLSNPAGYTGESVELVPLSEVRIKVASDPKNPDIFQVTSEAHYPTNVLEVKVRSQSRCFHRMVDKGRVQLQVVTMARESKP